MSSSEREIWSVDGSRLVATASHELAQLADRLTAKAAFFRATKEGARD